MKFRVLMIFWVMLFMQIFPGCRRESSESAVSTGESVEDLVMIRKIPNGKDIGGSCSGIGDCHVPLICESGACAIPPSVVNRVTPETRSINIVHGNGDIVSLYVEEARSDYDRALGLMFRKHIDEGWGMLFTFDHEREQSFWMRNTLISLDIIFIRADGRVINIHEGCTPLLDHISFRSEEPAKYVLEVGAGLARKHGIKPGSLIVIEQ